MIKNTNNIEVFTSEYREQKLDVIYTQKSLWLSQKNIGNLYGITQEQLKDELRTIFSDGIFSKDQNFAKFEIGDNKEIIKCYRLGIIISLGYRIKKSCETKYIINTTRVIKTKLSRENTIAEKRVTQEVKEIKEFSRKLSLIAKALKLAHNLRKQEIQKRVYA